MWHCSYWEKNSASFEKGMRISNIYIPLLSSVTEISIYLWYRLLENYVILYYFQQIFNVTIWIILYIIQIKTYDSVQYPVPRIFCHYNSCIPIQHGDIQSTVFSVQSITVSFIFMCYFVSISNILFFLTSRYFFLLFIRCFSHQLWVCHSVIYYHFILFAYFWIPYYGIFVICRVFLVLEFISASSLS